ncbi:MAG TPA: hypothetical protein VK559_08830 [Ferruginibacter sp.]|nr:hypothetical protein [Ferruginibacter sp.]
MTKPFFFQLSFILFLAVLLPRNVNAQPDHEHDPNSRQPAVVDNPAPGTSAEVVTPEGHTVVEPANKPVDDKPVDKPADNPSEDKGNTENNSGNEHDNNSGEHDNNDGGK